MLSTKVMIKLTFLVSVAAILDMLNLLINRYAKKEKMLSDSFWEIKLLIEKLTTDGRRQTNQH